MRHPHRKRTTLRTFHPIPHSKLTPGIGPFFTPTTDGKHMATNMLARTPFSAAVRRLHSAPFSDIFWYAGSKTIPALFGFLSIAIFIRMTGSVEYGYYSVILSASIVVVNLTSGWLRQSTLRYTGDTDNEATCLHPLAIAVTTAAVSVIAIPAVFLTLPHQANNAIFLAIAVAMTVSTAGQQFVVALLQAQRRARVIMWSESLRAALSVMLTVGLLAKTSIPGADAIMASAAAAAALAMLVGLRFLNPMVGTSGSYKTTRLWWNFGWPMSLWLAVAAVLQFSDRILIQHINGTSMAGQYGAIYDAASRILVVLIFPITMASHTLIMKHWNNDERHKAKLINRLSILAQIGTFIPFLVFIALFQNAAVNLLVGHIDSNMKSITIPLILGSFLWQLSLSTHKILEVHKRTAIMLTNVTVCTVVNVTGNLILLPHFGPSAAAWTTLAAALLYFTLTEITAMLFLGRRSKRWMIPDQRSTSIGGSHRRRSTRMGA